MTDYYLRPTNGLDTNDGLTFANAFQTLQKLIDSMAVAGDRGLCCPEAVETTSVSVDVDTNLGTTLNRIVLLTASTVDGTVDLSLTYTIQASASMTGLMHFKGTSEFYEFHNFIFDANANAAHAIYNNVDDAEWHLFENCRMTDATGDGCNIRGSGSGGWKLIDCEVDNNGGRGLDHIQSNRGGYYIDGGSIHDNTLDGMFANKQGMVLRNIAIYDNGGDGLELGSNSDASMLTNLTIYRNAGDGVKFSNASADAGYVLSGISSSDNGGYGFNYNGGGEAGNSLYMDYNHTHTNDSGASDLTLPGTHNVTGDPLFTSVVDGSENFIPLTGSPLIGAGISGKVIGAKDHASGGGGAASILGQIGLNGGMQ